jgi:hypothetical protein
LWSYIHPRVEVFCFSSRNVDLGFQGSIFEFLSKQMFGDGGFIGFVGLFVEGE